MILPPPTIAVSGTSRLHDRLGLPPGADGKLVNAFAIRAYNKIWNEWYRDQDLQDELLEDQDEIQHCSWEKDYYTSARPFSQKGDAITLPLGSRAPVRGIGTTGGAVGTNVEHQETGAVDKIYANFWGASGNDQVAVEEEVGTGYPNIYADLSEAEGVSINALREAFALQRYQEARARYGSRYTEYLRYLGVRSSDARLQRPEYIGGGRCNISFSEVLQTGPDVQGGADSAVGDLLGHGIATCRTRKFRRYFEEHGTILTLMSVRPKSMYVNGIGRKWSRTTKELYWQKELETIGQQEVLNSEVFADASAADDETFGFADRYRDYRHERSEVNGEFRDIFDYWHMGRTFATLPVLNDDFVKCTPTKRIHAVQVQDVLWCMINHSIQARRMVSRSAQSRIM